MKTFVLLLAILFANLGVKAQFTVTQTTNPDVNNHDLYCSFSLNKDYGFAAGNRILLKRVKDQWSTINLGSAFPTFVAVWASNTNNIKLVTKTGGILHSDGLSVIYDTTLTPILYCAKFFSANDYFVGGQGYLFHYKDGVWQSFALTGQFDQVIGIEGSDPNDLCLFINVTSRSEVAYYQNNAIINKLALNFSLRSSRQFNNKYYLCGADYKEYIYNKDNNSVNHLLDCSANAIWGIDNNTILLGNYDGNVSKFDGLSLSNIYNTDQYHVIESFSASADDSDNIYAVGDRGIILKITNTGVGINEVPNANLEMNIYPNPAKGFVNIDLGNQRAKTLISIFDYSGKIVLRTEANQALTKLNISGLDSGLYFIRGENIKGSFTKKLVIAR